MRLTDILQAGCVKVPLEADSKEHAIYELVDLLVGQTEIDDAAQLKQAVWQRELTRTTGIGHGVGIPHGKCAGISKLCMAVGIARPSIEFGAIDGKPVDLVFLLASPQDQTGPHIQALATISRMLTDVDFRSAIKSAGDSEELYRMIVEHESREMVG